MNEFETRDGLLRIGEFTVADLAESIGRTPYFAYSRSAIANRLRELRHALPKSIALHYAIKANPMPELVRYVAGMVDGLDVASLGELQLALDSDTAPNNIGFAGPGKTDDELESAIRSGITLQIESEMELDRSVGIGRKLGKTPAVAVRINPDFQLKGSGMKMSGTSTPFGIDVERVPNVLKAMGSPGVVFKGFHIYSGSQCLHTEAICESQRQCVSLAIQLASQAPNPPEVINIGGGFGIPYFAGDEQIDLAAIGRNLGDLVKRMQQESLDAQLVLELGRYIVGEAGIYVCRVVDRKVSKGKTFLVTDGGMHHHLAASGNLGQVLRRNFPVAVANRMNEDATDTATIVGRLCTPLDVLAHDAKLARATPGDLIAVFQSGAYGASASPAGFLSHPEPGELLI